MAIPWCQQKNRVGSRGLLPSWLQVILQLVGKDEFILGDITGHQVESYNKWSMKFVWWGLPFCGRWLNPGEVATCISKTARKGACLVYGKCEHNNSGSSRAIQQRFVGRSLNSLFWSRISFIQMLTFMSWYSLVITRLNVCGLCVLTGCCWWVLNRMTMPLVFCEGKLITKSTIAPSGYLAFCILWVSPNLLLGALLKAVQVEDKFQWIQNSADCK